MTAFKNHYAETMTESVAVIVADQKKNETYNNKDNNNHHENYCHHHYEKRQISSRQWNCISFTIILTVSFILLFTDGAIATSSSSSSSRCNNSYNRNSNTAFVHHFHQHHNINNNNDIFHHIKSGICNRIDHDKTFLSNRYNRPSVLFSTINRKSSSSNNSSNSNRSRSKKKKRKKNHNKIKTYKEIKEERRQLQEMKKLISSPNDSFSQTKEHHYDQHYYTHDKKSIHVENKIHSSSSQPNHTQHQQHQSQQQQKQQIMSQRIHNISVIRSSLTKDEERRSLNRKSKAQQLLDDLTMTDPFEESDGSQSSFTSNMNINKDREKYKKQNSSASSRKTSHQESDTKTVPDTYWYNGNLQDGKGDYVTRWSRGKKVAEPLRKYDPIAAEKLLFRQPTKWLVRNVQIGFPLALWAAGVVYDISTNQEKQNRQNRAKQLLSTISGLGPAIIKGGQALSSRSDLMPKEYLDELQKLQDDVPRFKNELALETVERELGVEFDSVFELMGTDPIAAASIGQVYKARVRSNGDLVALKIQRPGCEAIIALDLYVLRWWSGVANVLTTLLNRDINVQSIIDDFGELIYRELDYIAEAANAQRFSELYANQMKDVFVPKVYSDLTTSKVLTMEWVEGFRLTDSDNMDKYGLDRKKLVDTLVQCSLRQILGNGFFHAE